jgi:hypothetical protein
MDIDIDEDCPVNEPDAEDEDETVEVMPGVYVLPKKPKAKRYENSVGILKHDFPAIIHYTIRRTYL